MADTMVEWGGEQKTLLALVAEMANENYIGRYDEARVKSQISDCEGHDHRERSWWPHVPDGFRKNWSRLPFEVRLAIFAMACNG